MWKIAALAGAALVVSGCSVLGAPTAEVGECVDIDVNSASVSELEGFDCSKEHDVEVYAKSKLSIDGDYDQTTVDSASIDECLAAFEPYVGVDYYSSTLEVYYMYPDADGWKSGDREVVCVVYPLDADTGAAVRTTGSVKGSSK